MLNRETIWNSLELLFCIYDEKKRTFRLHPWPVHLFCFVFVVVVFVLGGGDMSRNAR